MLRLINNRGLLRSPIILHAFRPSRRTGSPLNRYAENHPHQCSSIGERFLTSRQEDDIGVDTFILYERDGNRNNLPRASFLVSSVNCIYWIWYVFDFVPAVNSAPVQDLHIDPAYGFAGLGISILIQSAFTLYPTSLISKISYQSLKKSPQQQPQVLVWKHSLPLVQPSKNPTKIPLGEIYMDKTSSDTSKILNDYGGDLQKFQGHIGLGLKNGYIPLLLEIREPFEVRQSQMLLEILLDPQRLQQQTARKADSNKQSDTKKKRAEKRGNRGKR